jgi:hypothetical protein
VYLVDWRAIPVNSLKNLPFGGAHMNLNSLVQKYKEHGYNPFPLAKRSKLPNMGTELLKYANGSVIPEFKNSSNIGIFAGSENHLRIIDADDEASQKKIEEKLREIGLLEKTPMVRTPHRNGLHFYIRIEDVPEEVSTYYKLDKAVGGGEFRLKPPAYVVAPGSVIEFGEYKFVQGNVEAICLAPIVDWKDMVWLVPEDRIRYSHQEQNLATPPVRLIHRPRTVNVERLLKQLKTAKKGEPIKKVDFTTGSYMKEKYPSRSEAEAAVVTDLILYGRTYDEIFDLFEVWQPGHYKEYSKKSRYLERLYIKAIAALSADNPRPYIAQLYACACSMPWPGRNGAYDHKVLLAILAQAWQFKTLYPQISMREIGTHAAINRRQTISKVVKRLTERGLLSYIEVLPYVKSQYDLYPFTSMCTIRNPTTPVINGAVVDNLPWYTAELWSNELLGGTAKLIYLHLNHETPVSAKELRRFTGKSMPAIEKSLVRLHMNELAKPVQGGWMRSDVSIDEFMERHELKSKYTLRAYRFARETQAYQFESSVWKSNHLRARIEVE